MPEYGKDLSNSKEEEISMTEFQKIIGRIIIELKDGTQKIVLNSKRI
jgi:hypothetical protein